MFSDYKHPLRFFQKRVVHTKFDIYVFIAEQYSYSWQKCSLCDNSYRINVYRLRAFWLDKSIVTCLFWIRS